MLKEHHFFFPFQVRDIIRLCTLSLPGDHVGEVRTNEQMSNALHLTSSTVKHVLRHSLWFICLSGISGGGTCQVHVTPDDVNINNNGITESRLLCVSIHTPPESRRCMNGT